ncbi:hypothetical protein [Corynebacterium sp. UBA2622]|nr:hypothetical protein [Corynebacterium sp. UBA2622]
MIDTIFTTIQQFISALGSLIQVPFYGLQELSSNFIGALGK